VQDAISEWIKNKIIPDGWEGIAIIRSIAQYILDYKYDKSKKLFPFTRPYLELYERCCCVYDLIEVELNTKNHVVQTEKYLGRLHSSLKPIVTSECHKSAVKDFKEKVHIFDRFREVLRLDVEGGYISKAGETAPDYETMKEMETALDNLIMEFEQTREAMSESEREAVDIILEHMKDHKKYLWGHKIVTKDKDGKKIVMFAYRTNNLIETFWRVIKHDIRRRSGCADTGYSLERVPASVCYTNNLRDEKYLEIVYGGSLSNMAKIFALYDSQNQAPKATNHQKRLYRGSLSRADKATVRNKDFVRQVTGTTVNCDNQLL
jgi:hypothetical protein